MLTTKMYGGWNLFNIKWLNNELMPVTMQSLSMHTKQAENKQNHNKLNIWSNDMK